MYLKVSWGQQQCRHKINSVMKKVLIHVGADRPRPTAAQGMGEGPILDVDSWDAHDITRRAWKHRHDLGAKADVKNLGNPHWAETRMKTGKGLAPLPEPDDEGCSESSSESDDKGCSERLPERRDKLTLRMEYPEFQSSDTR
jgi:hypothetical protein